MATYGADVPPAAASSSAAAFRPVRLSLTWSQRRAFVLTVAGFQALVWADALLNDGRFGGSRETALAGLVLIVMAAMTWWVGTSLTARGVVVHALPTLVIPWDDVQQIEVVSSLGISTVVVHHGRAALGTTRRTRLAAPTSGPMGYDAHFQDKVGVLRSSWAAHRLAGESSAA